MSSDRRARIPGGSGEGTATAGKQPAGRSPAVTRVIGIDPGSRVVGYAVLDVLGPGRWRYVECGTLVARGEDPVERVHELVGSLVEVLDELAPSSAAMETAFHGKSTSSALRLAEARGALREALMARGLRPGEYAPAHVKRLVAGRGAATKEEVSRRVALVCGLTKLPPADATDALAVALCHAQTSVGGAVTQGLPSTRVRPSLKRIGAAQARAGRARVGTAAAASSGLAETRSTVVAKRGAGRVSSSPPVPPNESTAASSAARAASPRAATESARRAARMAATTATPTTNAAPRKPAGSQAKNKSRTRP